MGAIGGVKSKYTGTIPKNQQNQEPISTDDDDNVDSNMDKYIESKFKKLSKIDETPELTDAVRDELNKQILAFAKYKTTPDRLSGNLPRHLESSDDEENYTQRTVRFTLPSKSEQNNLDIPPQNKKRKMSQRDLNTQSDSLSQKVLFDLLQKENFDRNSREINNFKYNIPPENIYPERETQSRQNINSDRIRQQLNFDPENIFEQNNSFDYFSPHENANYGNRQQSSDLPRRFATVRNSGINSQPNIEREYTRTSFMQSLRKIPVFNGDTYQNLRDFIDITETLLSFCINASEERELFQHMILNLRGEAKTLLKSLNNFDWQTIKNSLLKHFSYLANKNILSSQLENLHQEKNESLNEYSERARKLLKEKNSIYNDLTGQLSQDHDRTATRAFTNGIKDSKIRNILKIRGVDSLNTAIAAALEAEHDAITDIKRNEMFCRYCRLVGHLENECRNKENANSDIGKLASALRSMGNLFGRNRPNSQSNQRNFGFGGFNRSNFGRNSPNWNPNFNQNWNNFNGNRSNRGWNNGSNNNLNENWNQNMNPNHNQNWNNFNENWNNNRNANRGWNNGLNNYGNWNPNFNKNWNDFNDNRNANNGFNNNFNKNNRNGNGNGNGNGNLQPNRNNWPQNQRQQPRANNYIRRARINAINTDDSTDEFPSFYVHTFDYPDTDSTGFSSDSNTEN